MQIYAIGYGLNYDVVSEKLPCRLKNETKEPKPIQFKRKGCQREKGSARETHWYAQKRKQQLHTSAHRMCARYVQIYSNMICIVITNESKQTNGLPVCRFVLLVTRLWLLLLLLLLLPIIRLVNGLAMPHRAKSPNACTHTYKSCRIAFGSFCMCVCVSMNNVGIVLRSFIYSFFSASSSSSPVSSEQSNLQRCG